jgi:K+-transporting ATPase KdpF subunit
LKGHYARPIFHFDHHSFLRIELGICERLRKIMTLEYGIALAVAVGLGSYLFYALLRPERF